MRSRLEAMIALIVPRHVLPISLAKITIQITVLYLDKVNIMTKALSFAVSENTTAHDKSERSHRDRVLKKECSCPNWFEKSVGLVSK